MVNTCKKTCVHLEEDRQDNRVQRLLGRNRHVGPVGSPFFAPRSMIPASVQPLAGLKFAAKNLTQFPNTRKHENDNMERRG